MARFHIDSTVIIDSSCVPEDGFDDFEFAKYLEDSGKLKRSQTMPTQPTNSMCCLDTSTTSPQYELTDDSDGVDYVETVHSVVHKVSSGCAEIRKIVTGGEADGWYGVSSAGPSPTFCLGTMPVSTESVKLVHSIPAIMRAASMSLYQLNVPSLECMRVCNSVEISKQADASKASDRQIVPAVERTPLRIADALGNPGRPPKKEKKKPNTLDQTTARTTLMLCNIPKHCSRGSVMDMLQSEGYGDHVRFIYIPMNLRKSGNFGYAFVDFDSVRVAADCKSKLEGFNGWSEPGEKLMEIGWSETQGLDAHIQRYRNSPLMHESVDDELKPALFDKGVRVVFPEPTKNVRAPRLRRSCEDCVQARESRSMTV